MIKFLKKALKIGITLMLFKALFSGLAFGKKHTKPDNAELREKLTRLQYAVTQEDATEPPFKNAYWDNSRQGIYVDIVSGEPLFSSKDKFKSLSGVFAYYRSKSFTWAGI